MTLTFEGFPSLAERVYPLETGITFEDADKESWRAVDILYLQNIKEPKLENKEIQFISLL